MRVRRAAERYRSSSVPRSPWVGAAPWVKNTRDMELCSSREQPRTRVGDYSILLDPLPETLRYRPGTCVGGGVTPTTPRGFLS
jgi:hypothetical protein